jgi:hypothetical protein
VILSVGGKSVYFKGKTVNISSCGAYFRCRENFLPGEIIHYVIDLTSRWRGEHILKVYCKGRVVRVEPGIGSDSSQYFLVAATIDAWEPLRDHVWVEFRVATRPHNVLDKV